MDKKLQLLDSFMAQGSDGATYKVMAYEHLRHSELLTNGPDQWEPVGLTEYRLSTGERVEMAGDGQWRVLPSGVTLHSLTSVKPSTQRGSSSKTMAART